MMPQNVLIIIPCYNEEASLPLVLHELQNITLPAKYKIKILVINDCSKDKTNAAAKLFNTTVLNLPINLGIGGAMQTGFKYALYNNFNITVQLDGDGQHPPAELIKLLNGYEKSSADIVIGSRFLNKEGYQSLFFRRMGIRYFYSLNRLFTGNSIFDSTSGFRLFNKKAIQLAADNYPDDYPEPDSLIMFAKKGLIIKEVPVLMRERLGGKSSIHHSASLYYCIKVTISMLFSFIRNY